MKKGFTLIELLAVIVILAVIALIATPKVLNIIDETKEKAAVASANEYIYGLNTAIAAKDLKTNFKSNTCIVNSSGLICNNDELEYKPSGTIPTLGYMNIVNNEVTDYTLCVGNYKITKQGETITTEKDSNCYIEEAMYASPGLYLDGVMAYTWDELVDEGYITLGTYIYNGEETNAIYSSEYLGGFLYISDDIGYIGESAFEGAGLTGVILPNNLQYIGYYAFSHNSIKKINIPASVGGIAYCAFTNNPLTSITVDPNNQYYDSRDNSNAIIITTENFLIHGSKNTVIPNTVTAIADYAFWGVGLTSITIPDSVEEINFMAFADNKLTSINIPASVEWIGVNAFTNNPLTSITVDSNNQYYDSRDNSNAIIDTENNELVQGARNTVIPNTVTEIADYAFKDVGLTSVTIPEGVEYIGEYAFVNNQLTSINIPASVNDIGFLAFDKNPLTSITVDPNNPYYDSRNNSNAIIYTEDNFILQGSKNTVIPNTVIAIADSAFSWLGLTSITIPEGVEHIGEYAFADNQLTSINIPASVVSIYAGAFADNPLTSITVDPNNQYFDSRDNSNAIIITEYNGIVQGSRNTVIPASVVSIYDSAFEGVGITSITIPDSVEYIGDRAFAYNPLISITVDPNNQYFDSRDNSNAIIDTEYSELVQGSRNTVIPASVVSIYDSAFEGVGLTSITIPASVEYIGYSAFANNQITSVTFQNTENWWSRFPNIGMNCRMVKKVMANPQKMAEIINSNPDVELWVEEPESSSEPGMI